MLQRAIVWYGSLAALCCVVAVGCGGGDTPDVGIRAQGRLVQGGQPATLADFQDGYNFYQLTFKPAGGTGAGTLASVNQDGTFETQGIEPGKYRVGIAKIVTGTEGAVDEWGGKYNSPDSSLEVDVQKGQDIVIDMDKLGVPKS